MRLLVFGIFLFLCAVMAFFEFKNASWCNEYAASRIDHDGMSSIWHDVSALHSRLGAAFCLMIMLASQAFGCFKNQADRIKALEQRLGERVQNGFVLSPASQTRNPLL